MCVSCNPFKAFDTKVQCDRHCKDCHDIINKNLNNPTAKTANFEYKTNVAQKPSGIIVGTNQSHEQKVDNLTVQELPSTSENNLCSFCNYNCNRGIVSDDPEINSKEDTFDCLYCCSRFLQNTEKLDHMKTHTKEMPYKCEDCDFRTHNPFLLEDHHLRKKHMKGYLSNKAFLETQDCSSFSFSSFHNSPKKKKKKRTSQESTPSSTS